MINIDLNDYIRVGEGANGASYNHKQDPSIMLKLYFRNFEAAELELDVARKVYELGIPTPEPGDLVTDGKQVGSTISQNNIATIATSIQPGSIAIVKIGEKAIKVVMK